MAILTPWGPIYHCTIEKIGVFQHPWAQGCSGAEIPRFSLLYSGRGVHLGVHLGCTPGHPLGPLYHCVIEKYGVFGPLHPLGPRGAELPPISLLYSGTGCIWGVHLGVSGRPTFLV